jgi:hypothetical protein
MGARNKVAVLLQQHQDCTCARLGFVGAHVAGPLPQTMEREWLDMAAQLL